MSGKQIADKNFHGEGGMDPQTDLNEMETKFATSTPLYSRRA
jgi:hypothetical protein